jgi:multiple sugar transport system substrate-binding protein
LRRRDWLALSCCLFLILAACQPSSTPGPTPSASPSSPVTQTPAAAPTAHSTLAVDQSALKGVTIQVWYPWFGAEASLFESQVTDFNSSNSWGITVQVASQGNYAALYDNLSAALETPAQPDLVVALPEQALAWEARGDVVDLTPYVQDTRYGFSQAEIDDIPSVFWGQDQVGGRRLGVPAQRSARFLFYNQTWAEELGFASPPRNAEEFLKQACAANQVMRSDAVKDNDAKGGWLVDTDPMTALSWMLAFGGSVVEAQSYRFLTPDNIATFKFLKTMYDENCSWATFNPTPYDQFATRQALFATGSLEDLVDQSRAFTDAANQDQWTVLTFPGPNQSGLVIYGSSFVVLKSTDVRQLAAWLFARWMLSPENQARWVLSTGLFPLRTSSMASLQDYRQEHPQWAAAVELIPQGRLQPKLASWRIVRVMLGDGFDHIFRVDMPSGQIAVVLAEMDRTVTDISK